MGWDKVENEDGSTEFVRHVDGERFLLVEFDAPGWVWSYCEGTRNSHTILARNDDEGSESAADAVVAAERAVKRLERGP